MTTIQGKGSASPIANASHPWLRAYPPRVRWDATFTASPLPRLLDEAVAQHGGSTCTNFLGRKLTYAEIGLLTERATAGLQKLGVKKGTKVGLLLPNSPTFIIYYFAVLKAGGTVVNYNPLYTVEELTFQVEDSETELMVTLDLKLLFDKVEALLQSGTLTRAIVCSFPELLPTGKSVLYRLLKSKNLARPRASPVADRIILGADVLSHGGRPQPVTIAPYDDVAVLQYTGGTTGTPKGAMLTHANVHINTQQVAAWAPELAVGQERILSILPFFHVFAMTGVMNLGIARAAELVIMPRFSLEEALKIIDKTRPTIMPGVPTLFNAIMNHSRLKNYDFSSLKFCLSGGAPLPLEVRTQFEKLTSCKLVEGYGLSEASPVVTCNPLVGAAKPGSIGLPLPGTVVSLRDLADPEREVPLGEKGEICVRGPQVMKGYWNKPAETADAFVGDFLRTGDVARMDEDGYLYIEDRIKDLIISSGYNVYPRRIEEAIYDHAAVEEVTVIGIRDRHRGEAPKAFVKLKPGAETTAAELMKHLERKLSRIELPAEIEFRSALPKTIIGKLSKKELKAEEEARGR